MVGTTRAWPTGAGLLLGMVLLLGVSQAALAAEPSTGAVCSPAERALPSRRDRSGSSCFSGGCRPSVCAQARSMEGSVRGPSAPCAAHSGAGT